MIFILTGCQTTPPVPGTTAAAEKSAPAATGAPVTTGSLSPSSQTLTTAASTKTRPSATTPFQTYPTKGILSDPAEYSPGNPKTHAPVPLVPDLTDLTDNTRQESKVYLPVFEDYLKRTYPEQTFRIINIQNYQHQGITYKTARAYSQQSSDILLELYYDGNKIFDSFQKDVVGRQNTMNRWRSEFRKIMDPISRSVADRSEINLDVSYDYYPENISLIKLDQVLDSKSNAYKRCLELYYTVGFTDPVKISDTANRILTQVQSDGYTFGEYFIYLPKASGVKTAYKIPAELIGSPAFAAELQKALTGSSADNLIQVAEPYNP